MQFRVPSEPPKPPPFTFPDGFSGGMNISVTPDQIRLNETPDVLNMTLDNGIWEKRYGFDSVGTWGTTPIQGFHIFYTGDTPVFLFAHEGKIWQLNADGTRTDLCTGAKTLLTDAPTTFFDMDNRVYIMNGTDYCYYDGVNPVADVVGYVPLLTLGGSKDSAGTINEPLNYLSDSWWDSYSPDGEATTYPLTFKNLTDEPVIVEIDTATGTETYDDGGIFTVDRVAGTVTFSTPPAQGTNTLRIKGTKAGMMDKGLVLNSTLAVIYGGNNDTRVFVSGNADNANLRLQSGLLDATYFPEQNFDEIGNDAEAITGFGKVADVLFTYKERSRYYTYVEGPDENGFVSFPTLQVNNEHGCIASRTIQPAQDGLLALSAEGVTWSTPSTVRGQFNTKIVSKNISGKNGLVMGLLDNTKEDLANAHAYVINNKYWLHVKDKVWVLDLNYTDLQNGIYCWYPYDGVPGLANVFIEHDNYLYIGSQAGAIFRQVKDVDSDLQHYLDDGMEIDAYWTSPVLYLGGRDWIKKFERINVTFQEGYCTEHQLTFISEEGEETITIPQESGRFNFNYFNFNCFTFGTQNVIFPKSQPEKIGYKGTYFQFRLRNNDYNRRIAIVGITIHFSLKKLDK